ncbi:hypothetical protein PY650_24405 [Rhizobium calliandrae]|uniref:DUF5681 domain-containing protein n=1 Tax=Rhizobium calliandrae TaxID=1312182 RepID=A0ABT7KJC5_9HYPH|nr:hypothetical protein [Rhizobium calliandrae]MDL2408726.1 hypothetical protein [Rhizobium calliandrae]
MAKVGGARPGAGRKKGSLNQRTVELAADILGSAKSPLQYLLDVMMDEEAEQKRRDWAAERAAAFLHPRPAPIPRAITFPMKQIESAKDIPAAIAGVLGAASKGELSPSEAQSIVAIIDSHRKAVEAGEIMDRLEALEAAIAKR